MERTEIELSGWILLSIAGEEYLIGHSAQTGALLLSAPLVELDPAVTPGWAIADGGMRYRLAPSKGLRDAQDLDDAAALLTDSLTAWGIPDEERDLAIQQVFGPSPP